MKNRIRQILKEKGISQAELADLLGVRPHVVWRWCENQFQPKSRNLQKKIAKILETDYGDVFYIPKKG